MCSSVCSNMAVLAESIVNGRSPGLCSCRTLSVMVDSKAQCIGQSRNPVLETDVRRLVIELMLKHKTLMLVHNFMLVCVPGP